ncbi:MAG: hypothetical protein ACRDJ3_09215 [Solirubrobacteraceae bacterium]
MRAENRSEYEQEPERHRPRGDAIGARPRNVREAPAWAPAGIPRKGNRIGSIANNHKTPSRPYLAHTPPSGGNRGRVDTAACPSLTLAAAFYPLAHILDVGPPLSGLGWL